MKCPPYGEWPITFVSGRNQLAMIYNYLDRQQQKDRLMFAWMQWFVVVSPTASTTIIFAQ